MPTWSPSTRPTRVRHRGERSRRRLASSCAARRTARSRPTWRSSRARPTLGRCAQGRALAGAILYMAHGVGGIGWVGTLPEEFGRGYGRAVTWAAITEGLRRGARFTNLQASPMGEPMYRRMGFTTATHYRWFLATT